jgi:hypothetical protein
MGAQAVERVGIYMVSDGLSGARGAQTLLRKMPQDCFRHD